MAADRLMAQLLQIAENKSEPTPVRLAAIRDALDRAGLGAKQQTELNAEVTLETWEHKAQAAVVDWGELRALMPPADREVLDAELVEDAPEDATRHDSERPNPHRDQRMAEVEQEVSRLPARQPEKAPPWVSPESGAQTATRRADEHRKQAFAADKASKGLTPRTTRKR